MSGWRHEPFDRVMSDESGGNLKTPQSEFLSSGQYAIVDQGKDLIAGYTNDKSRLCRAQSPVIIFGDHTRCLKYVDFPFCMGADGVKVLRAKADNHPKYLYHYLRQLRLTTGGYDRHFKYLKRCTVSLPSLPEQRRIADILDNVDALRAKRGAALAQVDALTESIFLKMFGDRAENPEKQVTTRFGEVLDGPLRNGVSPSVFGTIGRTVLTLSAISGDRFDDTAVKEGLFESARTLHNAVDERDFLICRGNGNLRMVGKGRYPSRPMPDVVFPDTMIAARVLPDRVEPLFLEQVWNSAATRQQIESLARTTNGTLKVNQAILENIRIITPPLYRQRAFAARIRQIREVERLHMASRTQLDALFASLQHRAFRGKL